MDGSAGVLPGSVVWSAVSPPLPRPRGAVTDGIASELGKAVEVGARKSLLAGAGAGATAPRDDVKVGARGLGHLCVVRVCRVYRVCESLVALVTWILSFVSSASATALELDAYWGHVRHMDQWQ